MRRSHEVLLAVQTAVYQFEGSVNKFLMDDKGSTLIAVFGLPPLSHEDDATRGVLAALSIWCAMGPAAPLLPGNHVLCRPCCRHRA